MPSTRSGGLTNTASRKLLRSIESSRRRSLISARPCFHVISKVNITAPMSTGNQPPSNSLSAFAEKNTRSTTKKKPVAATHIHHG